MSKPLDAYPWANDFGDRFAIGLPNIWYGALAWAPDSTCEQDRSKYPDNGLYIPKRTWLTADDLESLERQNKPFEPGPCRVCGGDLEVQAMGPGTYTAWAHTPPSGTSYREWGDHYSESRVESYHSGDSRIVEMVRLIREAGLIK